MAFKREGDDKSLLNILQKRRVSELLVDDIPEEECHLLSNGRFACTVCSYKPIFDTVNMLTVHRRGKKHAYYMEKKKQSDMNYKTSLEKRQHEQWLKSGKVAAGKEKTPKISTKHHSLLTSCEYSARTSKHKSKPYDRKPRLNIDNNDSLSTASKTERKESKLSLFLENGKLKKDAPLTISDFRKAVRLTSSKEPTNAKPYIGLTGAPTSSGSTDTRTSISCCSLPRASTSTQHQKEEPSISSLKRENVVYVHKKYHKRESKKHKQSKVDTKTKAEQERVSTAEKYLACRGAGWKKDLDGKWIKDEGCEFDSDEEPPNLP